MALFCHEQAEATEERGRMDQIILRRYDELESLLAEKNIKSLFIVCDSAFPYLNIKS